MEQLELHQLEDHCIQEHLPPCTAVCPIHVDVRGVLAELGRGNVAAALAVLNKTLPFPGIIGRVCDHPCQTACNRKDAGEALEIAALERACADWGGPPAALKVFPKRGKRVAVAGGGLSGLTAAFDLVRKGYTVVLFEADGRLGGSLWEISEELLPRTLLMEETRRVEALGVEIRLNAPIADESALAELSTTFDVVYLAVGTPSAGSFGLALDAQGCVQVDPVTFVTDRAGVFAGGGMLHRSGESSFVLAMSEGRRAAISIDRYLQKVSLTAARYNEGPYVTRLYTNTEGIEPLPAVSMSDPRAGYTQTEASQEAQRCLQCECMECVKVCEYLEHFDGYPKKYIRQIYNNLSIVKGTRYANTFVNSCSLCGLCAEVCPEDLDMGEVCRRARQIMVAQDRMPPSAHEFALRDMAFSNSDKFALTRHAPGTESSAYLFFPGCQLSASAPQQVEKTYAYLREKLSGGVGLMLRCCGAPAEWAGRTDLFEEVRAGFMADYQALGSPQVILACSSCYRIFKEYLPDVACISLWDLFDAHGLPEEAGAVPQEGRAPLAVHDPCTTRHESHIHESVRHILERLGCAVEELPLSREKTECCSYGGLMWLANPDLARDVVRRRIGESPTDYVTYCAMCRDFFAAQGKPTLHLLDLLFPLSVEGYGSEGVDGARRGPGYSQRHENRIRLKRHLLRDVWGESVETEQGNEMIPLRFTEAVQERLEQRLILVEDIQAVIAFAEKTGTKFVNRETGHFLTHYKPNNVTYWVEYAPEGDGFVIFNAYSHRMELVEEESV